MTATCSLWWDIISPVAASRAASTPQRVVTRLQRAGGAEWGESSVSPHRLKRSSFAGVEGE